VFCGGFVRAVFGVEARVGEAEALDGTIVEEVFGNDLVDVAGVDVAVPDRFGIDDDDGAVLALVEAAGFVRADVVLEAGFLDGVLESCFKLFASLGKATGTGGGFVALVGADEDVVVEFWQSVIPCLLWLYNSFYFFSLSEMRCTGVFETIEARCNPTI
jgi:hypothetical protein